MPGRFYCRVLSHKIYYLHIDRPFCMTHHRPKQVGQIVCYSQIDSVFLFGTLFGITTNPEKKSEMNAEA